MGLFNRFRPGPRGMGDSTARSSDADTPMAIGTATKETEDHESRLPKNNLQTSVSDPEEALPAEDVQGGVQAMEATTLVWTKKSLIGVFICMWLVYLLNAFQSSTIGNFAPYVTSAWEAHSLLTVISVIASSMTAAVFIPLAKALDVWGRAEGYLTMVAFAELGLILMAASKNLATYCAANVSGNSTRRILWHTDKLIGLL